VRTRPNIKRIPRVRCPAGFTLIEVMVALAVGGIVVSAGMAALATVQDRSEHALIATTGAIEAAATRATVVDWLSGAFYSVREQGIRFEGLDADEFGWEWDEVVFPSRARTPLRTAVTTIRLFLDTDPETPERGLVAELTGLVGSEPLRMELIPGATGISVRYLPYGDGPVEWSVSWVNQSQLPRAVELTLMDDPEYPLPPLLKMPIRVAMVGMP
jgi:prepilin-type N-terminal cleavage/methylation domain-containing protein